MCKGSLVDNSEVSSDFITRWVSRRYPPSNPTDTSYLVNWRNLNAIGRPSALVLESDVVESVCSN